MRAREEAGGRGRGAEPRALVKHIQSEGGRRPRGDARWAVLSSGVAHSWKCTSGHAQGLDGI